MHYFKNNSEHLKLSLQQHESYHQVSQCHYLLGVTQSHFNLCSN